MQVEMYFTKRERNCTWCGLAIQVGMLAVYQTGVVENAVMHFGCWRQWAVDKYRGETMEDPTEVLVEIRREVVYLPSQELDGEYVSTNGGVLMHRLVTEVWGPRASTEEPKVAVRDVGFEDGSTVSEEGDLVVGERGSGME